MKKPFFISALLGFLVLVQFIHPPQPASAQTQVPVVQAVLFYSPSCGHCYYVITEVLPPLYEQYGQQLQILPVDASDPAGNVLFLSAITKMGLDRAAVPFLVIGNGYLVGSVDIPTQFPGLIEFYLAEGGVSWPDLPGLSEYMIASMSIQMATVNPGFATPTGIQTTSLPLLATTSPEDSAITPQPSPLSTPYLPTPPVYDLKNIQEKLAWDPVGNSLSIFVLAGMLFACGWAAWYLLKKPGFRLTGIVVWSILGLCIIGLGIAGYLSYVETQQVDAYCGVVGDCNTVQQSKYARLFGVLPIGILGVVGYLLILATLAGRHFLKGKQGEYASLALLLLTAFATFFSTYLTFLEPFVIGATCLWCLSSAVISTLLMLLAVPPGKLAFTHLMVKKD